MADLKVGDTLYIGVNGEFRTTTVQAIVGNQIVTMDEDELVEMQFLNDIDSGHYPYWYTTEKAVRDKELADAEETVAILSERLEESKLRLAELQQQEVKE